MTVRIMWFSRLLTLFVTVTTAFPAAAQNQQDFSRVEIKTTRIANNFYTLEGQGGMIGALVGPDGVFLVDSQFAPLTDKIVAAAKPTADFDARVPGITPQITERFIGQLYAELSAK